MLGHVALSETPISSISKILEGNAEMSGLASKASAGYWYTGRYSRYIWNFVEDVQKVLLYQTYLLQQWI